MSCEQFESRRFQAKAIKVIEQANEIIAEYQERGFLLTLRQLYYQFVARDLIENNLKSYKQLGVIVKNGRRAGLIDWDAIEDRTRNLHSSPTWASPAELISDAAHQYREELWAGQRWRPQVWIEKEALLGVIEGVCQEFRVPHFACRGNNSESEQYKAGKMAAAQMSAGISPIILHLGDHDPNGLDMTRDNRDRLTLFARRGVEVRRLALNMDQIEQYRPPPNFAKETDTRFAAYVKMYGDQSWELDALEPSVIEDLIRSELEKLIDPKIWEEAEAQESENRALLTAASENWAKVEDYLGGGR